MHSSSEDDDMEGPFPNDLSLQQVHFLHVDPAADRKSFPLNFLFLADFRRLSDPADDRQLCGSVWLQR